MDDHRANAASMARFRAGANPTLPEDTLYGLMLAHGAHHSAQIDLILADDTAGETDEWAAMQSHMDIIADALAAAIAKPFPAKAVCGCDDARSRTVRRHPASATPATAACPCRSARRGALTMLDHPPQPS